MFLVLNSARDRVNPRVTVQSGRIKLIKNTNDPIGNLNRDLPAYSAVPQPTAPPRALRTLDGRMNKTAFNVTMFVKQCVDSYSH